MFAISTRSITPTRVPSESAAPGSSVWTCTFSAVGVADDEQRVAEPLELLLERVRVELVALDHERRAVAEARQLLVDRLDADAPRLERRRRQLLAGHGRGDAAHELQQPRAARVDDAGVAEDVELLRRARDGLLAAADERRSRSVVDVGAVVAFASASSASSRMTESIVPSTGLRTARYAASRRSPERARDDRRRRSSSAAPSTSAAPRTICERMTPELPRAPISAARVTSCASAGRSVAGRSVERLDDGARGERHVRARCRRPGTG